MFKEKVTKYFIDEYLLCVYKTTTSDYLEWIPLVVSFELR